MKSNVKTIILIILGTIFAYPILINANFSYFGGYNSENLEVDIESKIKRAGFWNIDPIEIDNSNPNSNWSKTANENDWCNGNGSLSNPYVIENVTFNNPTGYGIKIINSKTEYFTIRNVTVYSAYYGGIKLENTNNGTIMNNNFSNNGWIAIYLDNSNANNISGNTLNNNDQGIFLRWSNNNTLSGNTANNNYYGIYLARSNNNTLSGNTVNNNNIYGLKLIESNDNIISGNTANDNRDGIFLSDSNNSTLSGNTANNNEVGIFLDASSDNNNISGNTINNNTQNGISLAYSYNNIISGNMMNECGLGLSGSFEELLSHRIGTTNLVNGKPLYYYTNKVNLDSSNFTNAGQVLLVNCSDSLILNLNTSYSSKGISLYYCNNNTLSGNTANNNDQGIFLRWSNNNTLSGNTANYNRYGIYLSRSSSNTVSGNNLMGNDECIVEEDCQGNVFRDNGSCSYGETGQPIPGYNLFFLLGILSVISIIISIKLKKS